MLVDELPATRQRFGGGDRLHYCRPVKGFTSKSTFYALTALTALLCAISISYRVRVEQANRTTGLCLEMSVVEDLAAAANTTLADALRTLKGNGLTAVLLSGETVADLVRRQELLYDASQAPMLIAKDHTIAERVSGALERRFGPGTWSRLALPDVGRAFVPIAGLPFDGVMTTSLGLVPDEARLAKGAGLQIIARHGNVNGANAGYIRGLLADSKKKGATVYLPEGDQVLGQRDLLPETALALHNLGIQYASPEFAKLGGDASLADRCQDILVRLHSVQQAELDKMGPDEVVERFEKAYRERNIRLLLLRPLSSASEDPVESLGILLHRVGAAVEHDGGKLGNPVPYTDPGVPTPLFLAIAFCAGTSVTWVGFQLISSRLLRFLGVGLIALLTVACILKSGREFMALAAAIAFPIGTYMTLDLANIRPWPDFARLSALSLVGGLCVAGLLNALPYYVRIDQFPGVKAAHFLPIVVIGFVLVGRQLNWRDAAKSPATWGALAIGFAALAALGFMLARTGNDNPAAVSGLELRLRDILDAVLYTRPRTKEFLLGHPALILGLYILMTARRQPEPKNMLIAGSLLITLGAIGQTSIVNTLCHLHTPVLLSLARILIGWVIGGILGGLLWALFRAMRPVTRG